jgi:excisionase family DNA binding protein
MGADERKDVLTTGQVARICHVAPRTVSKWFDTGKLRGYRIPGSRDRRIPRKQLEAFMRAHGMPLDGLDGGRCRVLIVDPEADGSLLEAMRAWDHYEVRMARNGFEAGLVAERFRPHVIVLEAARDPQEAAAICQNIKETADLQAAKVLAAGAADPQSLPRGFDGALPTPYGPEQLAEAVETVTDLIG